MAGIAVFSLVMAAIGLLVFGERMGLPASVAAFGVGGVLFLMLAASAVLGATSRLGDFVIGRDRGAAVAHGAVVAALLMLGFLYIGQYGTGDTLTWLWLLGGFAGARIILPVNPWRVFRPAYASGAGYRGGNSETLRGAAPAMMLATALGAATLLVALLPVVTSRMVEASGWPGPPVFGSLLGLICLLALFGGLVSIRRAALIGLALACLLLAMPVLPEWIRGHVLHASDASAVRLLVAQVMGDLASFAGVVLLHSGTNAGVAGFLLGLVSSQAAAAAPRRGTRTIAALMGIAAATLLVASLAFNDARLQALMTTALVGAAPAQWPVFVFDDVLRGWLSACGSLPDDARQAAIACGTIDPRLVLPAGSLRFDKGLGSAALALSNGFPVILGFLWTLLTLVIVLVACAILLHTAATGAAETVFNRLDSQPALRSSRLARIRLTIVAISVVIYVTETAGIRVAPDVTRWAMLGCCFVALSAIAAGWLLRAIRAIRHWRSARPAVQPGVEIHAG